MIIKVTDNTQFKHLQLAMFAQGYSWGCDTPHEVINIRSVCDVLMSYTQRRYMQIEASGGKMHMRSGCTPTHEFTYTITDTGITYEFKPIKTWRVAVKTNGDVVAVDPETGSVIACLLIASKSNAMFEYAIGAEDALETQGYDTSMFDWDEKGRIIIK